MVLYVPTFPLQTSTWGAICSSCYCVVICSIWLPFACYLQHVGSRSRICSISDPQPPSKTYYLYSKPIYLSTTYKTTALLPFFVQ